MGPADDIKHVTLLDLAPTYRPSGGGGEAFTPELARTRGVGTSGGDVVYIHERMSPVFFYVIGGHLIRKSRSGVSPWSHGQRVSDWDRDVAYAANGEIPWDQLEQNIRFALDEMGSDLSSRVPGSLSRPGRSRSPRFPLHVYRRFCRHRLDEEDPIIAGVEVKDEGDLFRVRADVGGEESGSILYSNTVYAAKTAQRLTEAVNLAILGLLTSRESIEAALKTSD